MRLPQRPFPLLLNTVGSIDRPIVVYSLGNKAKCRSTKANKQEYKIKRDERRKLNGHSVRHSVSQSVSEAVTLWQCGTEHITAAEAALVDLSESDLSCRLAVCCLLSVTFPNTTAYFSWHCSDGRRGDGKKKQAYTHCPEFINQTAVFCITSWISRLFEGDVKNIFLEWISKRYWFTGE